MKKLNIISVKLPKQQLENSVRTMQLYFGSQGTTRITDQQRLYDRVNRQIKALADKLGMDINDVYEQVSNEAQKRGKIVPKPGRDI